MQSSVPAMVIVPGAPASGKTTLARRLSSDLGLPLVAALAEHLAEGRFEPLDLPVPPLFVDTTDGLRPAYEEIRNFAAFQRTRMPA